MKNVFTFILVGLVILGCSGKTNQSSLTTTVNADLEVHIDDLEELDLGNILDDTKVVTSKYLTPEQSLQWLKRNDFTVYKSKEYINVYTLVRNRIYTYVTTIGPWYTLSNPRNFTLNGQRIIVGIDSEGNIRVKK